VLRTRGRVYSHLNIDSIITRLLLAYTKPAPEPSRYLDQGLRSATCRAQELASELQPVRSGSMHHHSRLGRGKRGNELHRVQALVILRARPREGPLDTTFVRGQRRHVVTDWHYTAISIRSV
jgi:hypothetical protein